MLLYFVSVQAGLPSRGANPLSIAFAFLLNNLARKDHWSLRLHHDIGSILVRRLENSTIIALIDEIFM